MTTRYYYDCPIKAAYMAKYFGMKFETYRGVPLVLRDCYFSEETIPAGRYMGEKYFVHPDWEKELKPQGADLGMDSEEYPCFLSVDGDWKRTGCYGLLSPVRIIQRNGQPFFWPESEEV